MRLLLLACATVAVLTPGAAGAPAADGQLFAAVGPGMTISLVDATGAPVRNLPPGAYDIRIDDRSEFHNFHLVGPGQVNAATELEFVGVRTVTVTLVDGEYTFACDAHSYDMIGQFTVGSGGGSGTTTPTPTKLVASVGPSMSISLKRGTRKVTTLKPGLYSITVRDRSAFHNFRLYGAGLSKATTIRFVGTQTWRVRLRVGVYRFRCDPHRLVMKGSFSVR